MPTIVLASGSPRRCELLARLIPNFGVLISDVDEEALTTEDPWETAERLAEAKATAVLRLRPDSLVIGGDTVVAFEDYGVYRQLAKPSDEAEARRMLRQLSGRRHMVITGVCLVCSTRLRTFSDTTYVEFRELGDQEIADYVSGGEPMDKAGAYAIQGGASGFVESVEGSISNVVGLPIEMLREELALMGVRPDRGDGALN